MRRFLAAAVLAVLAFGAGYATGSRARPSGDAHAIVEQSVAEVAVADAGQQAREAADVIARAEVDRATTQAAVALAEATLAGERADSLHHVAVAMANRLVADSAQRDSLTRAIEQANGERQRQVDSLRAASVALLFRARTAEARWAAADSAARDLQGKLHAALDRQRRLERMARRCRVGAAGPLVLTLHGLDAGVGAGVSCRL